MYRQTYSCCWWYIINYGFCIAPSYRQTYTHPSLFLKTYLSIYLSIHITGISNEFYFYLLACFGYNGNEKEAAAKKDDKQTNTFHKRSFKLKCSGSSSAKSSEFDLRTGTTNARFICLFFDLNLESRLILFFASVLLVKPRTQTQTARTRKNEKPYCCSWSNASASIY